MENQLILVECCLPKIHDPTSGSRPAVMVLQPSALPPEAAGLRPGHQHPPGSGGGPRLLPGPPSGTYPGPGSSQPHPCQHPGHLQGLRDHPHPGWAGGGGDGGGIGGHLSGQGQG